MAAAFGMVVRAVVQLATATPDEDRAPRAGDQLAFEGGEQGRPSMIPIPTGCRRISSHRRLAAGSKLRAQLLAIQVIVLSRSAQFRPGNPGCGFWRRFARDVAVNLECR
jgi:hypothetical protein